MALVDLVMPKLGESIMEATILKWLKQPGEMVQQDEAVLEIATDKVDSEVPSTVAGKLEETLFGVNDTVPIGTVIAKIRTEVSEFRQDSETMQPPTTHAVQEKPNAPSQSSENGQRGTAYKAPNKFYSPLVLNIATNEGIPLHELESIPGTGNEGRVTKRDILDYLSHRKKATRPLGTTATEQPGKDQTHPEVSIFSDETFEPPASRGLTTYSGNTEIIEMDRMRKLIAAHMINSQRTSAHVTSFTEADVTNLVQWREKVKKEFEKRENAKLTFTPLFIEAVVKCIKKYPLINSSVEVDKIILKKDINIGMATALQNGNLIVPVIKNADQLNLVGLAKHVNNLAENARNNHLRAEDTQGGTFTLTNVGIFGSLMGTPIINQPQVAILAVGAIKKRPVVVETSQGDSIAIRHMMYLSLSYDHRIIDGSLGATFLASIASELESFDPTRAY